MRASATLVLGFADSNSRRSLASVLTPDNEGAPRGLTLSIGGRGRIMEISVKSESPSTVVSTVLAFLRDISLFQEVWLLSHGTDGRGQRV